MTLDDRLAATREDFADALESRGFSRRTDAALVGAVFPAAGREQVRIELGQGWPFGPPTVTPEPPPAGNAERSWHDNFDGSMCLYTDDDRNGLPWLDPDAILAKINEWFDQRAAGWQNDAPDLDLDRYFLPADPRPTVLYGDLDRLVGQFVRLRKSGNNTLTVIGPGVAPPKSKPRQVFGYCAGLGTLRAPPRNWPQLAELLPDAIPMERAIEQNRVGLLLLRYDRAGHSGVLALAAAPKEKGGIALRSYASASTDDATVRLRSGPQRGVLATKSVAVVGCGAIGSFAADLLVRAGVGQITLVDDDVLRPGNLVRHLAGSDHVGLTKAHSTRRKLGGALCAAQLACAETSLRTPQHADDLLVAHDLVLDATADGSASALLRYAAEERGVHVLSVCVQNDGQTLRVDVVPPLDGAGPLPETVRRPSTAVAAYEGGCGSPVSPTPPHAVVEAAAMAARHACGLLAGAPLSPSGEIRDNPPAQDAP